jgi:hypothetical protein
VAVLLFFLVVAVVVMLALLLLLEMQTIVTVMPPMKCQRGCFHLSVMMTRIDADWIRAD